jgi:hypothetical protein
MRIPPHHYAPLKQRITDGEKLFDELRRGSARHPATHAAHFDAIISLSWGIYNRAVEKSGGFHDGTIIIQDPDKHVFSFFYEYAKQMWDYEHAPRYAVTQCHGYPRHSSHFPEEPDNQWGIDMRAPGSKTLEALLPTGKRHILFGALSGGRTFIKFEEYGLCVRDGSIVAHGLGYVRSVMRKVTATNDGKYTRREDVPRWVVKHYRKLANKASRKKVSIAKHPTTIAEMYYVAQELAKVHSTHKRARKFIKDLTECFDHLDIRRGNEVIL